MAPDSINTTNKGGGVGEIAVNGRRYRLPKQPVVVVCIDGSEPGYIERAVEAGTDDFLTKPINKSELLLRVRSVLKSRLQKRELDRALAYIEAVERGEK